MKEYKNLAYFSDEFLKQNQIIFLVTFLLKINSDSDDITSISTQWDYETFLKYRDEILYLKRSIDIFYNGEYYSYIKCELQPKDFEYNFCRIARLNYVPINEL
jgi:hypothetical protein